MRTGLIGLVSRENSNASSPDLKEWRKDSKQGQAIILGSFLGKIIEMFRLTGS